MVDAEDLVALVRQGWGREAVRLEPITLGFDADARTFRADTSDGKALFLKFRRTCAPGIGVSRILRELGIDAVLAPLPTLTGELAQANPEGWLLAYPFVQGENGFQRPPTLAQWRVFGAAWR